jgi:hypothetical protein
VLPMLCNIRCSYAGTFIGILGLGSACRGWLEVRKSKSELKEFMVLVIYSGMGPLVPIVTRACWNLTKHVGRCIGSRWLETF